MYLYLYCYLVTWLIEMMEDNHIEIIDSLIERHDITVKSNIKEDKLNIFLLLILYTLQGVPLGFSLAIPVIIQNVKSSSYSQQVCNFKNIFKLFI